MRAVRGEEWLLNVVLTHAVFFLSLAPLSLFSHTLTIPLLQALIKPLEYSHTCTMEFDEALLCFKTGAQLLPSCKSNWMILPLLQPATTVLEESIAADVNDSFGKASSGIAVYVLVVELAIAENCLSSPQ